VPDAAGEVAFEAAQCFASGLAFGLLACEVGGCLGVMAAFADGEAVQRAVELAVGAAVQALARGASRGDRDRGGAGEPRELGVSREAFDAGDLADQLGGRQHAATTLGQQLRREFGNDRAQLALKLVD